MSKIVEIFSDGACSGNPDPGGWAYLVRCNGVERCASGGEAHTTNNRMELTAAIMALESLEEPCSVRLVTDSQYLQQGITEWIVNWKKNGWRTAEKKPVKNQDLWQELDFLCSRHRIEWVWIRGHEGHPENEQVDSLATKAIPR